MLGCEEVIVVNFLPVGFYEEITPIYESVCRDLGFRPATPLIVRGVTGQSVNLSEWRSSNGDPISSLPYKV